jgi:hypothetical protein
MNEPTAGEYVVMLLKVAAVVAVMVMAAMAGAYFGLPGQPWAK